MTGCQGCWRNAFHKLKLREHREEIACVVGPSQLDASLLRKLVVLSRLALQKEL